MTSLTQASGRENTVIPSEKTQESYMFCFGCTCVEVSFPSFFARSSFLLRGSSFTTRREASDPLSMAFLAIPVTRTMFALKRDLLHLFR